VRVSQVAETLKITPDTVRFYTRKGYLKPIKESASGYKSYNDKDIQRLRFIISARQLGFTVDEIGEIVGDAEKGKSPCPLVRDLILKHLTETEHRFQEMLALRERMKSAIKNWEGKPDMEPTGTMICHLIENFTQDEK